jgi:glycosyltransferase involved in cell wall biosynthesis
VRVLLATDVFAPSTGGVERHVAALARRLAGTGHHTVVATLAPAGSTGDAEDGEVRVARLGGWSTTLIRRRARPEQHFHPTMADPALVRSLVALCREERVDLVHAHAWMAHSAVPAAARAGLPAVVSLHDYGLDCVVRNRMRPGDVPCAGAPLRACARCAGSRYGPARGLLLLAGLATSRRWWPGVATFVANSEEVADAARARGVECSVVSPWLVPEPAGEAAEAPVPDLPAGDFVAYVGALAPHKGIGVLTDAWQPPAPAPLVVLGARPEAGAPPLPAATRLHHDVDHERVLATLRRAAVTVVPSLYAEPFGLVAAEAMWAGSPVVASYVGALPHVLDGGRAGVLVPSGDPLALRAAVVELLHDPDRRAALTASGRRRSAELDGFATLLEVYRRALATGRPTSAGQQHPVAGPSTT